VHGLWSHLAGAWYAYGILAACAYFLLSVKPPVYLLDFAVFEAPPEWAVSHADIIATLRARGGFSEESLSFMARLLERSGTGDATHWPPATLRLLRPELGPRDAAGALVPFEGADASIAAAREMAETGMFSGGGGALAGARVRPAGRDFLVMHRPPFCPHLGGMGCSASVISIDLAKQLLQNRPRALALVVSLEDITQQLYLGEKRSMLVQNTLFRVGGAAIVLSNRPMDGFRAKYKLLHTVRVQDTSEKAHASVYQCEDEAGCRGVALSQDVPVVAGKALRDNLTLMGPAVLPLSEQIKVVLSLARRKVVTAVNAWADRAGIKRLPGSGGGEAGGDGRRAPGPPPTPPPPPRAGHPPLHPPRPPPLFGRCAAPQHAPPWHTAPSRATLRNWGNTSSSSIWYELKYVEAAEERFRLAPEDGGGHPVTRGQRVLQIAFGSGFKCNSAVWLRLK